MSKKESWSGRVYEDFEVGDVYEHPLGRTVTGTMLGYGYLDERRQSWLGRDPAPGAGIRRGYDIRSKRGLEYAGIEITTGAGNRAG